MMFKDFNKKIQHVLTYVSYDAYLIHQNILVKCSCLDPISKEADYNCKKCFGTGRKVIVKKIKISANEDTKNSNSIGSKNSYTLKKLFILSSINLDENDLVIDGNEVFYIYRILNKKGMEGNKTHYEVSSIKKTIGHDVILKNFRESLERIKK